MGFLSMRVPPELIAAAKAKAKAEGRSLSAVIRELVEKWLEADARLITTAPTLLAVAEELAECSEYWSEYDVPVGIHERLRRAIAAAKGEAGNADH